MEKINWIRVEERLPGNNRGIIFITQGCTSEDLYFGYLNTFKGIVGEFLSDEDIVILGVKYWAEKFEIPLPKE